MDAQSRVLVDNTARLNAGRALSARREKLPQDALRLLAEEVIARLASRYASQPIDHTPTDEGIAALADALLASDSDAGLNFVLDLKRKGIPRDTVYLGYISGAARLLGERWVNDDITFTDVTIAAGHLYVIMRALRPNFISDVADIKKGARALFSPTPGEDHTLGIMMAADMFRERGWQIDLKTGLDHDALVDAASVGRYPIIGLSAGSAKMIVPLTRLIASLRVISPGSAILVGGELAAIEPELAEIVDADSIAGDAPTAIREIERLFDLYSKAEQ